MRRQTVNNSKEKAATLGVGAQGSGNLGRSCKVELKAKPRQLATLIAIWSDDRRHFQGWEVAYA